MQVLKFSVESYNFPLKFLGNHLLKIILLIFLYFIIVTFRFADIYGNGRNQQGNTVGQLHH